MVSDAIMDVCSELNIIDPVEMEEYTLFVRTGEYKICLLREKCQQYDVKIAAALPKKCDLPCVRFLVGESRHHPSFNLFTDYHRVQFCTSMFPILSNNIKKDACIAWNSSM